MNVFTRLASVSVRLKVLLGLFISALLLVALAGFVTYEYNQTVQPVADVLVQALGNERAQALEDIVNNISNATSALANASALDYQALTRNTTQPGAEAAPLRRVEIAFQDALNEHQTIQQIRFVSLDGHVLASVPAAATTDDSQAQYFKDVQKRAPNAGIYVSAIQDDRAGTSIDFVALSIVADKPIGYVVATLDPSGSADPTTTSLFGTLKSADYRSGTVVFYLINATGAVESPWAPRAINSPRISTSSQSLVGQNFGSPREYTSPLTGQVAIGYVRTIHSLNAALITESPATLIGANSDIGQLVVRLGTVVLIALAILLGIALLLDSTIVRPVIQLREMVSRVAGGRSIDDLPVMRQRDELGQTYQTLTTLPEQLSQNLRTLETLIAQRTRNIEAAREIGLIISSIRDLDTLLNRVVPLIRQRFEAIYHVQLFLVDEAGRFAVLRVATGETGIKLLARGHRLAVGSQSVVGRATGESKPIVALDTSVSPLHRINEFLSETRAELGLPLLNGNKVIGALDLQSERADAFSEADVHLFQGFADQLAVAIINAQLYTESQARLTEIEALNRQLLGEAWRNYALSHRTSTNAGLNAHEAWSDLQRQAYESHQLVERVNVNSENSVTFAIPILLRDEVLGVVEWDVAPETYNENTRILAQELAARFAVTADNARLFEQSQRQTERERLVNDISNKLTQQSDVAQILQTAVKELGQALRVPQTSIRLVKGRDT